MVLIAQLLLEGITGDYLEWLANKVIMTTNKTRPYEHIISNAFHKQKKTANHIAYHMLESWENIPTSRVILASTSCTQGLFYPVAGVA